jgi:hypothetical protein
MASTTPTWSPPAPFTRRCHRVDEPAAWSAPTWPRRDVHHPDPVALVGRARARIGRRGCAGGRADLTAGDVNADFAVYTGTYEGPNFQTGLPPYDQPADGGAILVDDASTIDRAAHRDPCFA